ncbi:hypothetical protein TBS_05110 [Thermobispora bispora]
MGIGLCPKPRGVRLREALKITKKHSGGAHACAGGEVLIFPPVIDSGKAQKDRLLRVKPGCAGRATGARGRLRVKYTRIGA